MSELDDEGLDPIPTQDLLGGLPDDDQGLLSIETEQELRGLGGGAATADA